MHLGPSDGPLGALSFLGWVVNHAPSLHSFISLRLCGAAHRAACLAGGSPVPGIGYVPG